MSSDTVPRGSFTGRNFLVLLLLVMAVAMSFFLDKSLLCSTKELPYEKRQAVSLAATIGQEYSSSNFTKADDSLEPIRFIAVAGLYHSGTTAMWDSIHLNENVASSMGINLNAYTATNDGGYPPCGVPLRSDSTVDTAQVMGESSGVDQSNIHLLAEWGTIWGYWSKRTGASPIDQKLKEHSVQSTDIFYTWWKHTPPTHPFLACFRPDTLYVIMVRHPKKWQSSMKRQTYDLQYISKSKQWRMVRSDPRRLPPLELKFRSLFNVWEYYMNGYLGWNYVSAGKDCYGKSTALSDSVNCLGGKNEIPNNKRNILIVRYEDYIHEPQKTLASIFSFATRGLIDVERDKDKFVPYGSNTKLKEVSNKLHELEESGFFSIKNKSEWEGARNVLEMCARLGYSCDDSSDMLLKKR